MMMLGTPLDFVFSGCSVRYETIQTSEYERNITEKTKLRDFLHLSNMTLLTLTNFTLQCVPDIFSAANLFPVETSQEDAAQRAKDPKIPAPRST